MDAHERDRVRRRSPNAGAAAGILGGIRKGALSDAGTQIPMMDGCLEVLQRAVAAGIPT